ncbi:unnamed protein product [Schistocephalus solidus]|uniref:CKLF-like MARVEL transmembrane domain-containing protein 4 n=1 Tax=Schistocephalus solidus TaxID=70667 RepID=A0A183TKU9_SCHSO|nr:unnamed protein product [Schistocephalus solidus]
MDTFVQQMSSIPADFDLPPFLVWEKYFYNGNTQKDLVTSGVLGLLNFIAFCVAAAYGIIAAFGAAAFFFAVMLVVLAVDAYFLWRGKSSQPSFAIPHTKGPSYVGEGQPVAPSDTPNKIPDYSAEQSRMEP